MTHPGRLKTRGEGNAQARLTVEQVRFIKLAAYHGAQYNLLAKHFNVSQPHIYRIIRGIDWRWA